MEKYNYVAGYKRKNREKRDALKRIMCGESKSKLRCWINRCCYVEGATDKRGRLLIPKNIRIKMQFRAYELVYGKKY